MADENRNGAVDLDFGDGTHRFRLGMGELEELQEKTGVGPYVLLNRLFAGEWMVADVAQPIRLGLIGGGMEPIAALHLVRRYVEARPSWLVNAALARAIVMAALAGAPEELPGKGAAPEDQDEASSSPADALPSANGTGSPLPPASPPASSDA